MPFCKQLTIEAKEQQPHRPEEFYEFWMQALHSNLSMVCSLKSVSEGNTSHLADTYITFGFVPIGCSAQTVKLREFVNDCSRRAVHGWKIEPVIYRYKSGAISSFLRQALCFETNHHCHN